ncbi:MAG: hypothetical protein DDT19_02609 [Syntrophomonadaceae bacterium]|nr:hypothetical protein [Bacillota bacterium]
MELKGSYSFNGTKDERKSVYGVRFKSVEEAFEHILKVFTKEEIVRHLWYGFHINGVNKIAKPEPGQKMSEAEAYDTAEMALTEKFPSATFVRGVVKKKDISQEDREILAMTKGMGKERVIELIKRLKGE